MTALPIFQNNEFEAQPQLTDMFDVADNRQVFWTNLSGKEQPTDPHFTEDWPEIVPSLDDPLIHGRDAQAWAQVGQRALGQILNENDG